MGGEILMQRANLLAALRRFFVGRGFVEVETPVASVEAIPETHIDLFSFVERGSRMYLQASPEMAMKELLCQGSGAIFQICKAFRAGDYGPLHRPEFTMVEWYRPGDAMAAGIGLLAELVSYTLGTNNVQRTSYASSFERALSVNPHTAQLEQLRDTVARHAPRALPAVVDVTNRDDLLNVLLSECVEPTLGSDVPEIVYHYPASQSALATTTIDNQGHAVAERFELYYKGTELANGYHELTNADELRDRLKAVNAARRADKREPIPLPERLLSLMHDPGLAPCTGVALGFDRLFMCQLKAATIEF